MKAGKVLTAVLSATILIGSGILSGCKTEVGADRCEGTRKVVDKYIDGDGKPTLDIKCSKKGSMYVVWEADNEADRKEWDNYTVGQEYTG